MQGITGTVRIPRPSYAHTDFVYIGMARIMTCAKGLAKIIQGASWADTGLPECFQPTPERLAAPKTTVEQIWLEEDTTDVPLMH